MPPRLEIKSWQFADFKSLDAKEVGTFEGYLSTFGNIDHDGDIMNVKCFKGTLKEWKTKGQLPAMLWNHDSDEPIGDWMEMEADDVGLRVKGKIWIDGKLPPTDAAIKAYRVSTSTGPKAMSVGFIPRKATKNKDGNREILDVELMEGSVLQYGANDAALILSAKSRSFLGEDGKPMSIRDMEKALRDGGLSNNQAKALLANGYHALLRDDRAQVEDETNIRYIDDAAKRLANSMREYALTNQPAG